uniref:Uncharacterized protein n=1 Tax=Cacopsylla melanoneura TaxID=428564 RepID=A0A8D8W4K2_9HEMI
MCSFVFHFIFYFYFLYWYDYLHFIVCSNKMSSKIRVAWTPLLVRETGWFPKAKKKKHTNACLYIGDCLHFCLKVQTLCRRRTRILITAGIDHKGLSMVKRVYTTTFTLRG